MKQKALIEFFSSNFESIVVKRVKVCMYIWDEMNGLILLQTFLELQFSHT